MSRYTRLNNIYDNMKRRCYNPKSDVYKYYGGRGIKICDEWNNREKARLQNGTCSKGWLAFKKWALENGYTEKLSIDRIDVNKGYSPENCRWITHKEQCNNTRRNRLITYKGKTQNLMQWCEELNLSYRIVVQRICTYHWDIEKAFETNKNPNTRMLTYNGKTQTLTEWGKELGIKEATLSWRLKAGWTIEKSLSKH